MKTGRREHLDRNEMNKKRIYRKKIKTNKDPLAMLQSAKDIPLLERNAKNKGETALRFGNTVTRYNRSSRC